MVVNLKVRNADGSPIRDLRNIPMWSMANVNVDPNDISGIATGAVDTKQMTDKMFRCVPLSTVAPNIDLDYENGFVYRVNGQRAIIAQCDPNTEIYEGTTAKVIDDIKADIAKIKLPAGYSMEWAARRRCRNRPPRTSSSMCRSR